METFDPKPALNRYAGKTFAETPFENPLDSPLHEQRFRSVPAKEINVRDVYPSIYPMQIGFRAHGESGIEITDWWPHLARCVDDISFVRNMWTTDNDHAAENQIHTGRHRLDETQPSIGAWAHYGLGSVNENLPSFVVLGDRPGLIREHQLTRTIWVPAIPAFRLDLTRTILCALAGGSRISLRRSSCVNSNCLTNFTELLINATLWTNNCRHASSPMNSHSECSLLSLMPLI